MEKDLKRLEDCKEYYRPAVELYVPQLLKDGTKVIYVAEKEE